MEERRKTIFGRLADNIRKGDRVIWLIVVILMLISLVAIFSSTSTLAMHSGVSRWTIFAKHILLVAAGLMIIVLSSAIPSIKWYRMISALGFIGSLVLLLFLVLHLHIGDAIKVKTVNGASRTIDIFGFGLQVYEVVKIAMVMYLSWALQMYDARAFRLSNFLAERFPSALGWLAKDNVQLWIYIFLPIMIVTGLILLGSTGSAILCFCVMMVTLLIGGIKWKSLISPVLVVIAGGLLLVGTHIVSSGAAIPRMKTVFSRLHVPLPYPDKQAREEMRAEMELLSMEADELREGSEDHRKYLDKHRQAESAGIALVEGGRHIVGKGPGKSTQKYVVPVMYEDYIYSLLIEEYGLIFGIIVLLMYMSIFARGGIIISHTTNRYAQACVGGLVFLITFQALFHILINCNVGIVSGQTLPLISHGRCSFLCFCIAFGEILCISRMTTEKIEREKQKMQELMEKSEGGDIISDEIDN